MPDGMQSPPTVSHPISHPEHRQNNGGRRALRTAERCEHLAVIVARSVCSLTVVGGQLKEDQWRRQCRLTQILAV